MNANNDFEKDFNEDLFYPITHPGIEEYVNLDVTVYNDQVDETMFCGEWFGKNHVLPMYVFIVMIMKKVLVQTIFQLGLKKDDI